MRLLLCFGALHEPVVEILQAFMPASMRFRFRRGFGVRCGHTLTVDDKNGSVAHLNFAASYTATHFHFASDLLGGSRELRPPRSAC